jgi:hypothetical protein
VHPPSSISPALDLVVFRGVLVPSPGCACSASMCQRLTSTAARFLQDSVGGELAAETEEVVEPSGALSAGFGREVRRAGAKNSLGALVERGLGHCSRCNTHQYDDTILIWFRWLNHICFLVNLLYLLFCKSANHIPALFPAAYEIFGLDS